MIYYFKYTNGESFTLNNVDYVGFFHIKDNVVYSGRTHDEFSEELTKKTTFISDFYSNEMEFDNQYDSITNLSDINSNVFDVLNAEELNRMLESVDDNNITIYKSLVRYNPEIINFDEGNCQYYGLSSTPRDIRADDSMFPKTTISHIDPFSYSPEWSFLDNIVCGAVLISSDESFKYLCSDGHALYIIKGSFKDKDILEYVQIDTSSKYIFQIHHDNIENKIIILKQDEILIYDSINFITCDELLLLDKLNIARVSTTTEKFIKFGKNYRTFIRNGVFLQIIGKYSNEVFKEINLVEIGVKKTKIIEQDIAISSIILDLAIRSVDDYIGILFEFDNIPYVSFFDPFNLDTIIKDKEIFDFDNVTNRKILFSDFDSNLFFLNSTQKTQTRLISSPSYPSGQMREQNLKYFEKKKYGSTYHTFNGTILKWNTNKLDSNFYTNRFTYSVSINNTHYMVLVNSGRIYALKQPIQKSLDSAIDFNINKTFNGLRCGETSFGLFFNKTLSSILKDVVTIYNKAINSFIIGPDSILENKIKDITYDVNNLYMNGNEKVNILTIQRIFKLLIDIQKKLLSNLIS